MQTLQTMDIQAISHTDPQYPDRLLALYDPPSPLYIYGEAALLKMPMIAIVGSRMPSAEGVKNALYFARALSKAGFLILSGMARGIDGAAHRGALSLGEGHRTVAVCGTGLDITYPREHQLLADSIGRRGLLLSELAPGVGPRPSHFPRRNRIIAALSLGVLVIEAAEKSGSLITARLATELGREVFALPGSLYNPLSSGCHQLIQQGAKLTQHPQDVLDELSIYLKTSFKAT
ncbi:DNA-processing protein DprA [Polynucleobacter antarcticus]|uniref:DNA-protecting protein DprA n=1 Tax=Polynucleobacter antarcticus TaxID=1743162 RepID=A0A6M9Q4R3_9BURK|nr:DNA-processing protein DprA [Polynucleobacter antarcticus]QKM63533.1 DNA-protecting protein DprA [Polynucleobacter antarcticus]